MITEEPEKLDLRSHDIAADKREELLRLFPEARTEDGMIDFDRLKLALGEAVDVGKERYGMTWPGKADCFKVIQTPSMGTLLPRPKESLNWDTTENLIIEGDNLEVLKLLQKSYLGKVKMIYIDPPYNTGNDFIYPDDYTESLQTYLEFTGQVDSAGKKFNTNSDTDGRFHSKWMNMIYPRLYLARNLLRDDGSIWISIDDNEKSNLMAICNEIFGEDNYIATFVWQKRTTRENRKVFSTDHDYIVCYSRSSDQFQTTRGMLPLTDAVLDRYANPDNDPRGDWQSVSLNAQAGHATKAQFYQVTTPSGRVVEPPAGRCWIVTKDRMDELVADNRVWFGQSGDNVPRRKVFRTEAKDGLTPHTLWLADEVGTNDAAKKALIKLFDGVEVYDTPKPVGLIERIVDIGTATNSSDIVLDFFAGSGTVADAILQRNQANDGHRQFILVQLPEPCAPDGAAAIAGFSTIADVTRERVRRVVRLLGQKDALGMSRQQDLGYRAFTLTGSNFRAWESEVETSKQLEEQLQLHVDHVREDREPLDLLYEILLKSGFPLTAPVETLTLAEKQVYSIAGGALLICLAPDLTFEAIRAMADIGPERATCLDEGFSGNDQLKANAKQLFDSKGIVFKTI